MGHEMAVLGLVITSPGTVYISVSCEYVSAVITEPACAAAL
jgi:hypothetical protein